MITDRSDIEVQGTISGEKIGMKFDENSLVHLMSVLTDLYSDQELAIIREYSTNAYDSHVEAGQIRPIEVTTPTTLSPYLKVKDYGVGMDRDDIVNTYSKYGASTKRETNEQVGVLGLGCKSALTYTSQFSLVGIKDGVRTMVSIGRDEDGAGSMTVIEENLTVEPNGVEIIIPTKTYNSIQEKAENFFKYWKSGTVLLNGEDPTGIEGMRISDSLIIKKNDRYYTREHIVVMGGVPYKVNDAYFNLDNLNTSYSVIAYVNIGDVNFTPSREDLQYTRKTKATLDALKDQITQSLVAVAQADVDTAATPVEAFKKAFEWQNIIKGQKVAFSYKKQDIPESIDAPAGERIIVAPRDSHKLNSASRYPSLTAETLVDGLLIHGYDHDSFTPSHKKKLIKYSEDNGLMPTYYVLTNQPMKVSWVDTSNMVSWEDIRSIKLETARSFVSGRLTGSYKAWVKQSYHDELLAKDIDTSEDVFWYNRQSAMNRVINYVKTNYPTATVVELSPNRINKFCRDFPGAVKVEKAAINAYQEVAAKLTEEEKQAYALRSTRQWEIQSLKDLAGCPIEDYIEDPDVVEAIKIATLPLDQTVVNDLDNLNKVLQYVPGHRVIQYNDWVNPLEKYPLLNTSHLTHSVIYINATYMAEQESN
jgi:hypothetical protein